MVDSENPEWSADQGRNELEAFVAFDESSTLVLPDLTAPFDLRSAGGEDVVHPVRACAVDHPDDKTVIGGERHHWCGVHAASSASMVSHECERSKRACGPSNDGIGVPPVEASKAPWERASAPWRVSRVWVMGRVVAGVKARPQ